MPEVTTEQPERKKMVMTEEHKAKLKAGREKSLRERRALKAQPKESPSVVVSDSKIRMFGDVDRDDKGNIKSQFPAWYNEEHIEQLRESVRFLEHQLDNNLIAPEVRMSQQERLKREKGRLEEIEASRVKLSGKDKDDLVKIRGNLGEKISDSMFSKSDMEKGLADAHEEARRMIEPCIKINSDFEARLADECGVKIKDGKVSRKDAEKMWKIAGRALGDWNTNTERLRRG